MIAAILGQMSSNTVVDLEPVSADGLLVATLEGDLDLDSADEVRDTLAAAAKGTGCRYLHVDVSRLGFIDSYALGALVSARNSAAAVGVTLTLIDPSGPVRKAIQVTGLAHVFGLPANE
ncbi:anti-sigma-factor antagonist [Actinoplanes sp. N902-109]|nr:anti-sigma-factor antagonist [Actinoplanes sp. N902-109]